MTWCLLQETSQEKNTDLYSTYVDLSKAFDKKFIIIVRQVHDGMPARVQDNGESSVAFPVTNGVKQKCVLAPTLFSIMFSVMLFDAFSISDIGINIQYHTDGSVFNFRRLQVKAKVKTDIVNKLMFTDDSTECYYQSQHAKQCWQILSGLWQLA